MADILEIENLFIENAYKLVDKHPKIGEVKIQLGATMNCPILECHKLDLDEALFILKTIKARVMVREKPHDILQLIVR